MGDIVLAGSSPSLLHSFIARSSVQFAIKDPSDLHYFLGVQVIRTSDTLFMSQHKYVVDLIQNFNMHTAKPARTPIASRTSLSLLDGELLADLTEYRCMVGALQYFTMTSPDIVFAVHVVFQFMHALYTTHFHAVKRIFRYLQSTAAHGLHLRV